MCPLLPGNPWTLCHSCTCLSCLNVLVLLLFFRYNQFNYLPQPICIMQNSCPKNVPNILKVNKKCSVLFLFTQYVLCIHYLASLSIQQAFYCNKWTFSFSSLSPLWFCRDMLLCISISLSSPSPLELHFSSLVFIVSFSFPSYQLQSSSTEVIWFSIEGAEEQQHARPPAAYLSNANRLDSSKSHRNCMMYSRLVKYLPNE